MNTHCNVNPSAGPVEAGAPQLPDTCLDPADAWELAELLRLVIDWLTADRQRLDQSLTRYIGIDGYGLDQLRGDLRRFALLLGDPPPAFID